MSRMEVNNERDIAGEETAVRVTCNRHHPSRQMHRPQEYMASAACVAFFCVIGLDSGAEPGSDPLLLLGRLVPWSQTRLGGAAVGAHVDPRVDRGPFAQRVPFRTGRLLADRRSRIACVDAGLVASSHAQVPSSVLQDQPWLLRW